MMAHKPKSVQASRSQAQLVIEWQDGHRSQYPLGGLRAACPCAACRGGHEGMRVLPTPALLDAPLAPDASTDLLRLHAVGNYAIQPLWQDGHDDGIYSWDYLRALCPCGNHAAVGGQE